MEVNVFTKYKRPEKKFEAVDKERITEQAGYIPPQVQIMQFIQAGKRLNDFRKDQYDFDGSVDPDMSLEDPTREPNFDLADAAQLQQIANANLQNSLDIAKEQVDNPVEEPAAEPEA